MRLLVFLFLKCLLFTGDIFPDAMANREILQLIVRCPTRKNRSSSSSSAPKCPALIRLSDAERHAAQCQYNSRVRNPSSNGTSLNGGGGNSNNDTCTTCGESVGDVGNSHNAGQSVICPNALVACPFTSVGCEEKVGIFSLSLQITLS